MCIPSDIFWLPRPPALAPPLCLPDRAQQFGPNAADSALGRELPGSVQAAGPNRRPTAKGAGTAPSLTPPDQPETSRERHTARNQGLGVHTNSIRKLPFECAGSPWAAQPAPVRTEEAAICKRPRKPKGGAQLQAERT
ncbi:hypothetical protein DAKH74_053930 [Maudiozyma humilis]|uniref:Uncharacterized protein n=1 Tax=Maudiozyma humilis TaxID=51915 RepID=A0AAV5S5M0_MAUHU|nr:hypothetical protein DAKH74_053930 [Kazachstania humilis]